MRRRSLVVGLAGLPGCAALPAGRSTPSPTRTATTTRGPAMQVNRFEIAGPVEIGDPVPVRLDVANTGGTEGTFRSGISRQLGGGDWSATDRTVELSVPPGETRTKRIDLGPVGVMLPATYRLDAVGMTATTVFVSATLPWGTRHTLPDGVRLRVTEPTFHDSYTYPTADGEQTVSPPAGERWAVYTVTATNTADTEREAPDIIDIVMHREDDEFRAATFDGGNLDQYRGGPLGPEERRTGEVPVDVPTDIPLENLRVEYAATYPLGDVKLAWLSEG